MKAQGLENKVICLVPEIHTPTVSKQISLTFRKQLGFQNLQKLSGPPR